MHYHIFTNLGFLLSLERQHSNKALEDFVDVIPAKVKLIKLSHKECIVKFSGPQEGESESEKGTPFASARGTAPLHYQFTLSSPTDHTCSHFNIPLLEKEEPT